MTAKLLKFIDKIKADKKAIKNLSGKSESYELRVSSDIRIKVDYSYSNIIITKKDKVETELAIYNCGSDSYSAFKSSTNGKTEELTADKFIKAANELLAVAGYKI